MEVESLLCARDYISEPKGRMSLAGILQYVRAARFPHPFGDLVVFATVRLDGHDLDDPPDVLIRIINADGRVVASGGTQALETPTTTDHGFVYFIVHTRFLSVVFPGPGLYRVEIIARRRIARSTTLVVEGRAV